MLNYTKNYVILKFLLTNEEEEMSKITQFL